VGWHPGEFAALRIPIKERGRRMNEMLEAITALWSADGVSYEGEFYRFEDLTIEPKPVQKPHPPIWIGGGTQPSEKIYGQKVDTIRPVLRRIAKYASTWVPHSSATAEMVADDWAIIREEMAGFGRDPGEMTKVYSNFIHVLGPGESPDTATERFRVFSGMDLDYWQEYYLLGEAEALAERIRRKIDALGGVEHVILNPVDWDPAMLERVASDVLPRVADRPR
jgi:alkanesulfonate monooxygenase SsuD/methylene tetrahydromethanopterin reductase-like flavin-dependent oxidoreductase (luciferase family)